MGGTFYYRILYDSNNRVCYLADGNDRKIIDDLERNSWRLFFIVIVFKTTNARADLRPCSVIPRVDTGLMLFLWFAFLLSLLGTQFNIKP